MAAKEWERERDTEEYREKEGEIERLVALFLLQIFKKTRFYLFLTHKRCTHYTLLLLHQRDRKGQRDRKRRLRKTCE
jgi:hypothetical protein